MSTHQLVYVVFAIVLVIALVFDLGLLSKKNHSVTIKQAFYQTVFWVGLALVFFVLPMAIPRPVNMPSLALSLITPFWLACCCWVSMAI